tara:strand:- start:133 stop:849 length:717 start_codon:yes stop_codon:yes gene_type:complete
MDKKEKIDKDWTLENAFNSSAGSISAPRFPREYLVKTLSSSLNTGLDPLPIDSSKRVLEIGAFGANNIRFLYEKGYKQIYGIEITESLVDLCRSSADFLCQGSIPKENIVIGSNLNIPFEDNFFDLIISISTIHYSTGSDINKALKLWHRKLKKDGRIFLETAGPEHSFLLDSERIATNEWKWGDKSGFRSGKPAGFFDNEEHWVTTLESIFSKVSIGRVTEKSEFNTIDSFTALCIK